MQFIDLKTQYARNKEKIDKAVLDVMGDGRYIMGPQVKELEERLAKFVGVKHCISCSNGTDAMTIPLMAMGIGEGDAVFTTAFTFFATAEVIALRGAVPVFVDIDPDTFNIDPAALEAAIERTLKEGKLTPKAIIAVDLFGLPADYFRLRAISKKYGLVLIEDGAQGFGGEIIGKKACSFGDVATTSFFPAKPLGCYGDGGAIFLNDDELAGKCESIRVHGKGSEKYDNVRIGLNARLDTIQAAILSCKLDIFPEEIESRQRVARLYTERLRDVVKTPVIPKGYRSVYAQYTVMLPEGTDRSAVMAKMKERGVPTFVYYPKPMHLQGAFSALGHKEGDFPHAEAASARVLSLPMHPYLEEAEIEQIANALRESL
ncbi:DegT/DnrJ/EryC1/StrS family aminotransferase [Zongyangia hominis]|uniref:DegT/DnrJ/EryC1/StrS aminotransferase family protein n=1 Tax=Zongyangia hominis TaxID=2763677 RepID=A0A926IAU7_9FIRM|nr:DegT/DnrJ/EryC1/StrS aminotransferase family protein [Zongyangia hominis]MBC8569475.1 DegT/DnrJ/EryC1/StrS aminotransferase family protein [Zongyangia hominis]